MVSNSFSKIFVNYDKIIVKESDITGDIPIFFSANDWICNESIKK